MYNHAHIIHIIIVVHKHAIIAHIIIVMVYANNAIKMDVQNVSAHIIDIIKHVYKYALLATTQRIIH